MPLGDFDFGAKTTRRCQPAGRSVPRRGLPVRVLTVLVLVLDTSTPAVTAGLVEVAVEGDGAAVVRAERRVVDARAHGELLAPQVAAALAEAGVRPGGLGAIVAGLGPGPYTGLRVGLVTAAAMGQALGIPTYGVCSLDGLGRAAGVGRVLAATDARRREVYFATYLDGVRVAGPDVARPADLDVGGAVDVDRAVGEGAAIYADVLGLPFDPELRYPPVAALAALAVDRIVAGAPGDRLTPLYLRRPDAVASAARKPALR
jgi:tRNA threonylcarbamoyl adenosine modification protein YeaZ